MISLFLYAGVVSDDAGLPWSRPHGLRGCYPDCEEDLVSLSCKSSILYTGDASLKTPRLLKALVDYLGRSRTCHLGALQVMHHGARNSWHRGVVRALRPRFSIFSSDPAHRKLQHPHAEVWKDFEWSGRIQVDRHNGCQLAISELAPHLYELVACRCLTRQ